MAIGEVKSYGGEVSRLLESISTSADKISFKKKGQESGINPYVREDSEENGKKAAELKWSGGFIEPEVSVSIQEYISQHPFKDSAAEKYKHQSYLPDSQTPNFLASNTDFSWGRLEYAVTAYNYVKEINTPPKELINVLHEYNQDFRFEV